ncbi:hypothetical protein SynA1562_00136 [Synechococcus sp. A15-62]|nr:hypothetical protein SynA1562_00136 [Synechococcus sp. A15-62]
MLNLWSSLAKILYESSHTQAALIYQLQEKIILNLYSSAPDILL